MGGAVSSGRDNNELIDNLMGGGYIRTQAVERVFRVLDRADYMSPEARDQAYKDLAWRNGLLHLSAPCIYSEVMEALELKPGLSFLNLGSGTGYLSTLAGLILGSGGISHGVDCYQAVIDYANKKLGQFLEKSATLDEYDFCFPKFYCGNALALTPLQATYDRVYCGAGVLGKYENHFKQLVKVGGVLVMPLRDTLVQMRRIAPDEWRTRKLLNVSFALLRVPLDDDLAEPLKMDELTPPALQVVARGAIRAAMRRGLQRRQPELREPEPRAPPAPRPYPRRVCIPLDADSDAEGLNELHDLDPASGANEMNALLSLVLSMGQNRVAGSLRLDSIDDFDTSPASSDAEAPLRPDRDRDRNSDRNPDRDPARDRDPDRDGDEEDDDGDDDDDYDEGSARAGEIRFEWRRSRRGAPPDAAPDRPYRALRPGRPRPCLRPIRMRRVRPAPEDEPEPEPDAAAAAVAKPASDEADEPGETVSTSTTRYVDAPTGVQVSVDTVYESYEDVADEDEDEGEVEDEEMASSPESSSSSEAETERRARRRGSKRQKLDSGIGEGASSASGATPDKSSSESSEGGGGGARRRGAGGGGGGGRALVRRLRLSAAMKAAAKELPLPLALQLYVNLGRCFDF